MTAPSALPVLMYHGLHADAAAHGRYDAVYSLHPDEFARQLDWLQAHGYRSVLPGQAAEGRGVVLSFDDGDASNLEVALPLLRERGMVAVFFVTSGFIGTPGMLAEDGVRALAEAGMAIGAHGRSHAYLEDLDAAELASELRDSRALLQAITGTTVDALALPGGRGGARELVAARAAGYRHCYGSVPGVNRDAPAVGWRQRLAMRRGTDPSTFGAMVEWRGPRPRWERLRFEGLRLPKRMLGNGGYERLRALAVGRGA